MNNSRLKFVDTSCIFLWCHLAGDVTCKCTPSVASEILHSSCIYCWT